MQLNILQCTTQPPTTKDYLAQNVTCATVGNPCMEVAAHVVGQIRDYAENKVPFDELEMVYESTPRLGINYTTAKRIGFEVSFEDLQMIDKVYRND